MASLLKRLERYLRSPRGRQTVARAERMARDPRTQAKIRKALRRLNKRHR